MAILGIIFLVLIAIAVLFGLYLLLTSLGDIARYGRIRKM